jgi:hypothetical protein
MFICSVLTILLRDGHSMSTGSKHLLKLSCFLSDRYPEGLKLAYFFLVLSEID